LSADTFQTGHHFVSQSHYNIRCKHVGGRRKTSRRNPEENNRIVRAGVKCAGGLRKAKVFPCLRAAIGILMLEGILIHYAATNWPERSNHHRAR
jgi:hypothetical protein